MNDPIELLGIIQDALVVIGEHIPQEAQYNCGMAHYAAPEDEVSGIIAGHQEHGGGYDPSNVSDMILADKLADHGDPREMIVRRDLGYRTQTGTGSGMIDNLFRHLGEIVGRDAYSMRSGSPIRAAIPGGELTIYPHHDDYGRNKAYQVGWTHGNHQAYYAAAMHPDEVADLLDHFQIPHKIQRSQQPTQNAAYQETHYDDDSFSFPTFTDMRLPPPTIPGSIAPGSTQSLEQFGSPWVSPAGFPREAQAGRQFSRYGETVPYMAPEDEITGLASQQHTGGAYDPNNTTDHILADKLADHDDPRETIVRRDLSYRGPGGRDFDRAWERHMSAITGNDPAFRVPHHSYHGRHDIPGGHLDIEGYGSVGETQPQGYSVEWAHGPTSRYAAAMHPTEVASLLDYFGIPHSIRGNTPPDPQSSNLSDPVQSGGLSGTHYTLDIGETIRQGIENSQRQWRDEFNHNYVQDTTAGGVLADALDDAGEPHAPFYRNLVESGSPSIHTKQGVPHQVRLGQPNSTFRDDQQGWSIRSTDVPGAVVAHRRLGGLSFPTHTAVLHAPALREWAAHPKVSPSLRAHLLNSAEYLEGQESQQEPTQNAQYDDLDGSMYSFSGSGTGGDGESPNHDRWYDEEDEEEQSNYDDIGESAEGFSGHEQPDRDYWRKKTPYSRTDYSHKAFQARALEAPNDAVNRQVYADWLEDYAPHTVHPDTLNFLRTHQGNAWISTHPESGEVKAGPHYTWDDIRKANGETPHFNEMFPNEQHGWFGPAGMGQDHTPHGEPHSGPGGTHFVTHEQDAYPTHRYNTWQFHPDTGGIEWRGSRSASGDRSQEVHADAHQASQTHPPVPQQPSGLEPREISENVNFSRYQRTDYDFGDTDVTESYEEHKGTHYADNYTHADFHRAIHQNPQQSMGGLAYADWLEEHGMPAHAHLIRSHVGEMERHNSGIDPSNQEQFDPSGMAGYPENIEGVPPEHIINKPGRFTLDTTRFRDGHVRVNLHGPRTFKNNVLWWSHTAHEDQAVPLIHQMIQEGAGVDPGSFYQPEDFQQEEEPDQPPQVDEAMESEHLSRYERTDYVQSGDPDTHDAMMQSIVEKRDLSGLGPFSDFLQEQGIPGAHLAREAYWHSRDPEQMTPPLHMGEWWDHSRSHNSEYIDENGNGFEGAAPDSSVAIKSSYSQDYTGKIHGALSVIHGPQKTPYLSPYGYLYYSVPVSSREHLAHLTQDLPEPMRQVIHAHMEPHLPSNPDFQPQMMSRYSRTDYASEQELHQMLASISPQAWRGWNHPQSPHFDMTPRLVAADYLDDLHADTGNQDYARQAALLRDTRRHAYMTPQHGIQDAGELARHLERGGSTSNFGGGHHFDRNWPDVGNYIDAGLWSSTDGHDPLDENYDRSMIHPRTLAAMIADASHFTSMNPNPARGDTGIDFMLSRNGHGSGFFAKPETYGEHTDHLQDAAEKHGYYELSPGDDGMIRGSYEATPIDDQPTQAARYSDTAWSSGGGILHEDHSDFRGKEKPWEGPRYYPETYQDSINYGYVSPQQEWQERDAIADWVSQPHTHLSNYPNLSPVIEQDGNQRYARTDYSHEAFHQAIQEHPDDTTARGVYADWLEENDPNSVSQDTLHFLRHHPGNAWVSSHPQTGEVQAGPVLDWNDLRAANGEQYGWTAAYGGHPSKHYGFFPTFATPEMVGEDTYPAEHTPHGPVHSGPGGHYFVTEGYGDEENPRRYDLWKFHPEDGGISLRMPSRWMEHSQEAAHQNANRLSRNPSDPPNQSSTASRGGAPSASDTVMGRDFLRGVSENTGEEQLSRYAEDDPQQAWTDPHAAFHANIYPELGGNPLEATNHYVYADFLRENGQHDEADFRQAMGDWVGGGRRDSHPMYWPATDPKFPWIVTRNLPEGVDRAAVERIRDGVRGIRGTRNKPEIAYSPSGAYLGWRSYSGMEEGLRRAFMKNRQQSQAG